MKFDGKKFASEIEQKVIDKVRNLAEQPRVVSILVGNPSNPSGQVDPASELYTRLKKQAAERVGIQFEVIKLSEKLKVKSLKNKIKEIGEREEVDGVMVQLPVPGLQGPSLKEVLAGIPNEKDVDGLRYPESKILPATVRAVLYILDEIQSSDHSSIRLRSGQGSELIWKQRFVVVGSRGAVGKPLVRELGKQGVEVLEVEWDTPENERMQKCKSADVLISCVGKPGLVTGEMVKEGVIAIDVGMSKTEDGVVGDMTCEVYNKANVSVEVPGGVGPVTIASLMANVLDFLA